MNIYDYLMQKNLYINFYIYFTTKTHGITDKQKKRYFYPCADIWIGQIGALHCTLNNNAAHASKFFTSGIAIISVPVVSSVSRVSEKRVGCRMVYPVYPVAVVYP